MNLSTYRKNTGRVFRIRPSQKAAILSMVNFDELSIFLIDYKVDSHWPAVSTYFIYIIIVVFKRATIYESIVIPESNRNTRIRIRWEDEHWRAFAAEGSADDQFLCDYFIFGQPFSCGKQVAAHVRCTCSGKVF